MQEAMKIIHSDGDAQFQNLIGKMLHYNGMVNSTSIYRFASWKKNCPAHDRWEPVVEAIQLSASMTVKDVLVALRSLLGVDSVEMNMCNNKFIDKIVAGQPEKEFEVMLPESKLDGFVSSDPELRQLSYRTLFHKSFFENVDDSFPYQDLTLQQIGIPPFDVVQVSTEKGVFYVELDGDAQQFK